MQANNPIGTDRKNPSHRFKIAVAILALLILGFFARQWLLLRQQNNQFISMRAGMTQLFSKIMADKSINSPIDSNISSQCATQNIGKTKKNLVCFTTINLVYAGVTQQSAVDLTTKLEAKVADFSQTRDYPKHDTVDQTDNWSYQSEPTPKHPDKLHCKFSHVMSSTSSTLNVSMMCAGNAKESFFINNS